MSDLIERLRADEPMGVLSGCCDTVKLVNPDGPEAAGLIEAQQAEIARLREAIKMADDIITDSWGEDQMEAGDCQAVNILRAALTAIMEVSEKVVWGPFKEAPRDGTKIDVWIESDLSCGGYRVCNIIFKRGFWFAAGESHPYDFHRTPSHFMVAPEGPSATGSI